MSNLIIMVGIPGSGKSTKAKQIADENTVVLSSDDIRRVLCGDIKDQDHNQFVFDTLQKAARMALLDNKNVIIDATNISRKNRKTFIDLGHDYNANLIAYDMCVPFTTCIERNAKRERKVPEDVLSRMRAQYENPTLAEGFNEIKQIF